MSVLGDLRKVLSVEGVSQKREQAKLEDVLRDALEQAPPAKEKAQVIASEQAAERVAETGNRQLAFVTTASLATFSGASSVIAIIWLFLKASFPHAPFLKENYFPLLLAVLIGVFLLYMDITDSERTTPLKKKDYVIKGVIALINSFFLAASVVGIGTTMAPGQQQSSGQQKQQEQQAPRQQNELEKQESPAQQ